MFNLLIFLVTIGILVVIHEYGHFIVARKCGVKVERFSVGFGKPLLRWFDKRGTEFVIALIPLGGYVKMLDERVAPVEEVLKSQAFNNKTIGQRAMIIAAGPIANFLLAIFIFWILGMIGSTSIKSIVLSVEPNSIVQKANIPKDSVLISINGKDASSVLNAEQQFALLAKNNATTAHLVFADRFDEDMTFEKQLDLSNWQFNPQTDFAYLSLGFVFPTYPLVIKDVVAGEPAALAGLKAGDTIIKANAELIKSHASFVQFINYHANENIYLTVIRNNQELEIQLTPRKIIEKQGAKTVALGRIGVFFAKTALNDDYMINNRYNPITSIYIAIKEFGLRVGLIGSFLLDAISGNASMDDLAGPVGIAQAAGSQLSFGITAYLAFLAFLSINLGIMNLLPIPVLDGGHLMFLAVEKIKGSPVSVKIQQNFYLVGAALLLLLMLITFISDFMRF